MRRQTRHSEGYELTDEAGGEPSAGELPLELVGMQERRHRQKPDMFEAKPAQMWTKKRPLEEGKGEEVEDGKDGGEGRWRERERHTSLMS